LLEKIFCCSTFKEDIVPLLEPVKTEVAAPQKLFVSSIRKFKNTFVPFFSLEVSALTTNVIG
jgi:hypothetical protein